MTEAKSAIENAISGDAQSTTGYRLDWRLYHQKSVIHLGASGAQARFVDLEVAAECSARAVDLALSADEIPGASTAALTACWIDYCRGHLSDALDWATRSVNYDGSNAAAVFHVSKILMALNRPAEAVKSLRDAALMDRRIILAALDEDDVDFARYRETVVRAFEDLRVEVLAKLQAELADLLRRASSWRLMRQDE